MSAYTLKVIKKSLLTVVMIILSIVAVLPFIWMLSASFKPTGDIFKFPIKWIPERLTFQNYISVWFANIPFYSFLLNSIKVSTLSVIGEVFTSALAGYAFAKINFKGRNLVFVIYIASMMIPNQMMLVPRFVLFRLWGLYNTLWALILPGMFTAFGTFLLRQFFSGLPNELIEASKLDGCSHLKTFLLIALPLATPALCTLIIFSFVSSWNAYENPLVFISNKQLFTIPLGLLEFQSEDQTNYGAILAASVCSMLPIFILFLSLQKYFIKGIAMSGIKG
jgi:multiple sugar transport system permease protein